MQAYPRTGYGPPEAAYGGFHAPGVGGLESEGRRMASRTCVISWAPGASKRQSGLGANRTARGPQRVTYAYPVSAGARVAQALFFAPEYLYLCQKLLASSRSPRCSKESTARAVQPSRQRGPAIGGFGIDIPGNPRTTARRHSAKERRHWHQDLIHPSSRLCLYRRR